MNEFVKRMIMERRERDGRRYGRGMYDRAQYRSGSTIPEYAAMDYPNDYNHDYGGEYSGNIEYRGDYGYDGRRGVKGTGPYGIGGRRYYGRRRDYESGDYNWRDYAKDEELMLTKADMEDWKHNLENADGTMGPHFTATQIMQAAQAVGARMSGYTEEDLCMTANMLYSDYCEVLKTLIPKEKEAHLYTKMAKAFLEDPDAAVRGGEKLTTYFYCIVTEE